MQAILNNNDLLNNILEESAREVGKILDLNERKSGGYLILSKVIQVKYEGGVLKPLNRIDARKGEIFYVRILRRGLAEEIWLITFR